MRLLLSALLVLTTATAHAEPRVSSIRLAAIERLEKKLGSMRGTLRKSEKNIFVTRKMVERFKPLAKGEFFHERMARLEAEEKPAASLVGLTGGSVVQDVLLADGVSMSEIYAVAGIEPSEGGGSLTGQGFDSVDLDSIMDSVDAMIEGQ